MGWWCHFGGRGHHGFHGHEHGFRGHREDHGAPALGDRLMLALVLESLAEKPGSGYDVVQALEARLGGTWGFGPQAVYPVLRLAEDAGFATAASADGKTSYTLSEAGHMALAERRDELQAFWSRVARLKARRELGLLFHDVKQLACDFREELAGDRLDQARIAELKAAIARVHDVLRPQKPEARAS